MRKSDLIGVAQKIRTYLLSLPSTKNNKDLEGFCAIYTTLFLNELGDIDDASWAFNNEHCFPVVNDVVVDGTAQQFGFTYPPVFVGTYKEIYKKCKVNHIQFWSRNITGKTAKELVLALKQEGWPMGQIPTKKYGVRRITKDIGPF